MIYEAYQEKVLKVAKVLKAIFRHIALIISTLSVVVLLVISFLATKGMILGEVEYQSEIVYGDKIRVEAEALFSKVEFEFAQEDSDDWSDDEPTLVGDYKLRVKSNASFGRNKYSEEIPFSIIPKDIKVQILSANVIYGEDPKIGAGIPETDKIECTEYIYDDITQKSTNVQPKKENIKIYSEDGDDITFCYNISTETSKVNIMPRPLTVTVSSKSMVYNGTTLAFDGYEISDGTLGFTDKLGAEFNSSITEVGQIFNTPDLKVRNGDGNDVTHHYSMTVEKGTLTVTQRPIVVITPDDEKIYDGEKLENFYFDAYYGELSSEEATLVGTLEKDTEIEIEPDYEEVTLGGTLEVDTKIEIETDYPVFDDSIEIVPEITYDEDILIEPDTEPHIFHHTQEIETEDGVKFICYVNYYDHIDANHDTYCDVCDMILDSVEHEYKDENEDRVCDKCVDLIEEEGKIVSYLHLHLDKDDNLYCDYCGEAFNPATDSDMSEIIYVSGNSGDNTGDEQPPANIPNASIANKDKYIIDTTKPVLADGHHTVFDSIASITNAGSIENVIQISIVDENGVDKTANYAIFYDYGTLTVKKRELTLTTESGEWVYDGQEHTTPVVVGGDGIAPKNTFNVTGTSIKNVGQVTNSIVCSILDYNGNSAADNYNITIINGILEVTPRKIWVESESGSYVYDGYEHYLPEIQVGSEDRANDTHLAPNQYIQVESYPIVVNSSQGVVENALVYNIYDGTEIVNSNYEIVEFWGTIEVTRRPLKYVTVDFSEIYDGYEHTFDSVIFEDENVFEGMAFEPQIEYSSIVLKNYTPEAIENDISFTITDPDGNDIIGNFNIECTYMGMLEIRQRELIITTGSEEWTYDGYFHQNTEISYGGDGIAAGQSIDVGFMNIKDAQEIDNAVAYQIYDFDGETNVTDNYLVIENYGTLTINKRYVAYSTWDESRLYDGLKHTFETIILEDPTIFDDMAYDPVFEYTSFIEFMNHTPEAVDNEVEFLVMDIYGEYVTDNFEFDCIHTGKICIEKRTITVNTGSYTWKYDGDEHSLPLSLEFGGDGIADGDMTSIASFTTVKNYTPDDVENVIEYSISNMYGEDSVALGNYDITEVNYGTLRIDPIHIYVRAVNSTIDYDGNNHALNIVVTDVEDGENVFLINYIAGSYSMIYGENDDIFAVTYYTPVKYFTNGSIDFYFEFEITNTAGEDAINDLQNYVVDEIDYGTVEIVKRPLSYATPDDDFIYNGQYQSNTDIYFVTGALCVGDRVEIISAPELIDYTGISVRNEIEFIIVNSDGEDVTGNYEINEDYVGYLYMNRRRVYLNTATNEWVYDGLPHSDTSVTVNTSYANGYSAIEGDIFTPSRYTEITDIGTVKNALSGFTVYSTERDMDVTSNYQIVTVRGNLTIVQRPIDIKPIDISKVYDGNGVIVDSWEYTDSNEFELLDGHYIASIEFVNNSAINAGKYEPEIVEGSIVILDAEGNDVTDMYDISTEKGSIDISKLVIKIETHSASKDYDGSRLEYHEFDVTYINGSAINGHTIYPNFTGKIIGVGIVDNSYDGVMVLDSEGNDVSKNYEIIDSFGKLEITKSNVGQIYSNEENYEYLKLNAYGDYLGYGFGAEPIYTNKNYLDLGPESLVSMALQNAGYTTSKALDIVSNYNIRPYYQDIAQRYYYTFPSEIYGDVSLLLGYLGELNSYELEYRDWVYENYLTIDYETYSFMLDIIYAEGFDASDISIYDDVANYIQDSNKYGFTYADQLDAAENIAIAFLSHQYGDEGVCRHYATAATMLYRALGIPARYVEGYLVKTTAGEWVDITTPGHAWVEVYVDGLGWITIEVTAGSSGFELDGELLSGGLGGIITYEEKMDLHIKPEDIDQIYDGKEHEHTGNFEDAECDCDMENGVTIDDLIEMGYTIEVEISKVPVKDAGEHKTTIEDVHIYYEGEDVTHRFNIETHEGTTNIDKAQISMTPVDNEKTYDGTPLKGSTELVEQDIIDAWKELGFTFEYDVTGERTEVNEGIMSPSTASKVENIHVYDSEGNDVTDNFDFNTEETGKIEINAFEIEIFLYKNQKIYDGTALSYDTFGDTKYYSIRNQLPEGYVLEEFDVTMLLTNVGKIEIDMLNSDYMGLGVDYKVTKDGIDYSNNFKIKFVQIGNKEYTPMEVTARKITVTTASASKVYDGNTFTNEEFTVGGAGLANGENIVLVFSGECTAPGQECLNTIASFYITDRNGRVIHSATIDTYESVYVYSSESCNYEITFNFGTLELLKEE